MTAAGGEYMLCWCSAHAACESSLDFVLSMGALYLVGPTPLEQHRTCVSGRTCAIHGIEGDGLREADRFFVLETCGVTGVVTRSAEDRQRAGCKRYPLFRVRCACVARVGATGLRGAPHEVEDRRYPWLDTKHARSRKTWCGVDPAELCQLLQDV